MKEPSCRLREEELAFFAKIGADITHEMRNVLSIVGENAGLLDDQLALARGRKGTRFLRSSRKSQLGSTGRSRKESRSWSVSAGLPMPRMSRGLPSI